MTIDDREKLQSISSFPDLVEYLSEELGWPIDTSNFEELTFEYDADELGIDTETAAKIEKIYQLRPFVSGQPWGIFLVNFEPKRLPVVALRRILSKLVVKKRVSSDKSHQPTWNLHDLLFISNFGEDEHREIAFAHFSEETDSSPLPTLRVLGWDDADTPLHIDHVHSELKNNLYWPNDDTDIDTWRNQWSETFTLKHREVITTSKDLAVKLADLATRIRKRANHILAIETPSGQLRQLHAAFKKALIHDLSQDDFADMYAQTITYGLLTARVSRPAGVTPDTLPAMVPSTNPFLREMLETFLTTGGRKGGINFDELGIHEVVDTLNSPDTHIEDILRDFGNRTRQEDPVIHFYEFFLKEYDAEKKVKRGVFYTPWPVVSYIIRSVHELLQTEFGLEDGLASTITWGEMAAINQEISIPKGIPEEEPFVMILDPATGTATFLVEVIDIIHKTMIEKWRTSGKTDCEISALWNEYVPNHLLPRLYGYELMMAPYAIAHMKIGLKLHETGYLFGSDARANIYLTNALEPSSLLAADEAANLFEALGHEAQAVNEVKRDKRFTVVIGNPPYSISSSNNSDWIQKLISKYKDGLGEKNINSLSDDYIKFLRFVEHLFSHVPLGVAAMITNNSFLDGITHRKMRASMLQSFQKSFFIDLHGSTKIAEKVPNGIDENVFDIQQGVCINMFVSSFQKNPGQGFHYDCYGTRNYKYKILSDCNLASLRWEQLEVRQPYWFFKPKDFSLEEEYNRGWSLVSIFKKFSTGIKFRKDNLLVKNNFSISDVERLLNDIHTLKPNEIFKKYDFSETPDWLLEDKKHYFDPTRTKDIRRVTYRPFDYRFTFYPIDDIKYIIVRGDSRVALMKHLIHGHNLSLITTRLNRQVSNGYFYVTRDISDLHLLDNARDSVQVFPLFLYEKNTSIFAENPRQSNFTEHFISTISSQLSDDITPDLIFNYIYSIFFSPSYRSRYFEFLKIDFPRIPITNKSHLFIELAKLGNKLVALHLTESSRVNEFITNWQGSTPSCEIDKITYEDDTVWINKEKTAGFRGVPEDVWNFHIGGYQVCEKWLKDRQAKGGKNPRPGRRLTEEDINHYQKTVVALHETIRIMGEIDQVIEEHGGWPGAFVTDTEESSIG